jgi:hypothetical protein
VDVALRPSSAVFVVAAALGAAGCDRGAAAVPDARPRTIEASAFSCEGGRCVQRHVRLPDDGEWRCAERDGVAWCAGGEPAAGVVRAPAERGFACGVRRAPAGGRVERICVDPSPDVPFGKRDAYRCRFLQERGTMRECVEARVAVRKVTSRAAPDCWVDADCAPGACDRGRCTERAP